LHQPLQLTVDLPSQTVSDGQGFTASFPLEASRKQRLLEGLDDIGLSLKRQDAITAFEQKQRATLPWQWAHLPS
jgi:3-isopropylmalate/(R)-2-methylmalate dehydratase small subunit